MAGGVSVEAVTAHTRGASKFLDKQNVRYLLTH